MNPAAAARDNSTFDWTAQRVAFTGRLGALTRADAIDVVRRCGGQPCHSVTRETTLLVVGGAGLPLNQDGRFSRKLQRARWLVSQQQPLELIDETNFLQRAGILPALQEHAQRFTLADVERITGLSRDRVRHFIRSGVVTSREAEHGVVLFDFDEVRYLRDLAALIGHGVGVPAVRRTLQRLQSWLPNVRALRQALTALDVWGQSLVIRNADGRLQEANGQQLFDFDSDDEPPTIALPRDLYAEALHWEAARNWQAAAEALEALLLRDGPDAELCFQLGNLHFQNDRLEASGERLRQAVELEPDFAEAWNNLGNVLALLGRTSASVIAYQRAVDLDPDWSDARYGLADVLDQSGLPKEAESHWRRLLKMESEYSQYAHRRLKPS